jgi:taurine dioxygenase
MIVRRLAGALGAEILDVDLAGELKVAQVDEIRRAFLEHLVIFFRDQSLTPAQFMAFARRMGEPVEYPFVKGIDGFPQVIEVKKLEHEKHNFGGIWHSDTAYLQEPPMGSMLLAREVPPQGGDTEFANQYLAYESLSEGMKALLSSLVGVNESAKADVTRTREDRIKESGAEVKHYVAEHPVVRTHPETQRKALYVNVGHTTRFKGLTVEESSPILEFLYRPQVRAEFTCRFRWAPGSLAFWDNRCTQHNPINDYHGYRRVMHRITLAGDKPR